MVILDTNIFLRYLVEPNSPELQRQHTAASDFFELLADEAAGAMVSEAVLAEVFFVLTSPKVYALSASDAVNMVRPLLSLRGLKLANREQIGLALDLYATTPVLGFDDSLLAARSLITRHPICSFDRHFDRIPGVHRVEPNDLPLAA